MQPLADIRAGSPLYAAEQPVVMLGSKAETLAFLKPLVRCAVVPDLLCFSVVDWRSEPSSILERVHATFGARRLAVRSSAGCEDGAESSMAGRFRTCLDVDGSDPIVVEHAIERVIASYTGNPRDQVLVQEMVRDVAVSGVITTHVVHDGAPYYVFNYDDDSGRPDAITGGLGVSKTVMVYRHSGNGFVDSPRVEKWLELAHELERLTGRVPLDIEFVQSHDGVLYLLQARRIAVEKRWDRAAAEAMSRAYEHIERFVTERSKLRGNLVGHRTILGEMPDWNPAEIIGSAPRPLAASLYRYLVTDSVWRRARERMGYRHPNNESLMVMIGGRPYVDVRNSFNSFLPADLPDDAAQTLVDAWLDRLDGSPELHDKVEFEVAQTALDFDFDRAFADRYGHLGPRFFEPFKHAVRALTLRCMSQAADGSLRRALDEIQQLEELQRNYSTGSADSVGETLHAAARRLGDCKRFGTLSFAVIARHAFIAESLLRTAIDRGAADRERIDEFRRSIVTITTHMTRDFSAVYAGQQDAASFLRRYGHLRAGTYDILSPRYDQRRELFSDCVIPAGVERERAPFELSAAERRGFASLLHEAGLSAISPDEVLGYARVAIAGREHAKFVFSRNLSDALELIAHWGEALGLDREDLSYLPVHPILDSVNGSGWSNPREHFRAAVEEGRAGMALTRVLRLGYLIRGVRDIYVVPVHRSAPNFVTTHRVEGQTILVGNGMPADTPLVGKIVCIESGDPGFDWIFTRGLVGLLTKFGGSNSHMAIRCAEFGLPAAIGCGEHAFERLVAAGRVELNCADKIVRPTYG